MSEKCSEDAEARLAQLDRASASGAGANQSNPAEQPAVSANLRGIIRELLYGYDCEYIPQLERAASLMAGIVMEQLKDERAAVVAYLRANQGRYVWELSDAIERGEHRR